MEFASGVGQTADGGVCLRGYTDSRRWSLSPESDRQTAVEFVSGVRQTAGGGVCLRSLTATAAAAVPTDMGPTRHLGNDAAATDGA